MPDNETDAKDTGSSFGNTGDSETHPGNPLVRKDDPVWKVSKEDKSLAEGDAGDVSDGVGNSPLTATNATSGSGQGGTGIFGTGK